jgi:hypothetical protein
MCHVYKSRIDVRLCCFVISRVLEDLVTMVPRLGLHLIMRFSCICKLFDIRMEILEQRQDAIGLPVF